MNTIPHLLDVDDLSAHYGHVQALKPTSLCIAEGELVTILGPNGAGKSTLMKVLLGLLPFDGTAAVLGHDVRSHPSQIRRFARASATCRSATATSSA